MVGAQGVLRAVRRKFVENIIDIRVVGSQNGGEYADQPDQQDYGHSDDRSAVV